MKRSERVAKMLEGKQAKWTDEQGTSELVSEEIRDREGVSVYRCSWLARPYIWEIRLYDRSHGVQREWGLPEDKSFATAEECAEHAWHVLHGGP